ncbi:MAG TPA: reverse transcriptase domain-containing protein, partial [Gemmataceae bacterium]|nr:reverse transcriptase domain-containing protein [Gemmataceae bacterium]
MSSSTVQFITEMKLRELHRQREQFRTDYGRLSEEVAAAPTPAERLRRLYDGLRRLRFAGQPLHPDVVNLDVLLYEAQAGALSPDVLSLWLRRLEDELTAGRLRSEFVYLFGALLQEWAHEAPEDTRLREEGREARERLLREAVTDPGPNRHEDVLGPLFAGMAPGLAEVTERLRERCHEELREPVDVGELTPVLQRLGRDIYQPPGLRREARRFAANELLGKELADALTILVAELHTWDWPAEGLTKRALWTRNKWRLYLNEDLPTACLLELVAGRWSTILDQTLGDQTTVTECRARLKKLLELKAPEFVIENGRRMLREAERMQGLGFAEVGDVWEEETAAAGAGAEPEGGSILTQRVLQQRRLRDLVGGAEYDADYAGGNAAVQLVHAEIRLARAAFPDRPLYVVKTDLQDYYASLPHDLLLTVLRRLGVAEADVQFFARFLAPPLRDDGAAPVRMRRGVPMAHGLSRMLAELLLRLLEKHVRGEGRVRVVRLVDDVCLLTPDADSALAAWRRLQEFCAACGLRVNLAKSGSLCLGGELPEGLPRGRPRWGMLELDEAGHWQVHAESFEAHRTQARERVAGARSVLSRVQLYNANAKYLLGALTPGAALGDEHREAVAEAVRQFHQHFFGPGKGIVAGLCEAIRERFPLGSGDASTVPESWVYWPITAGGLGLRNPLVVAGQYASTDRERKPVAAPHERPAGWNQHINDWARFYAHLLQPVEPAEPKKTQVMETLVKDFIARGVEITAGRQQDLSSYWRWVLCTYGPQILQRFGTFRFLITELVPLQLISRQLVQDTSLGDAGEPAAAGPAKE